MPKVTYDKKAGTKTVLDENGKTVYYKYGSKDQYKEVYNKQGKTITKAGYKDVYNKKGNTTTWKDGEKQILNKQGYTAYRTDGTIRTIDKKGDTKTLKNPTTIVDKTQYGGDRDVKHIDKEGNTHITNKHNGKTTYVIKDKEGIATDGRVKDDMGKITYPKSGKLPEVKVTPPKKETAPVKTGTGQTVAELWKAKTGTSWSEAKKQGLTDGSAKSNLALMAKLKSGDYKPKAKVETKVQPKVEAKVEEPKMATKSAAEINAEMVKESAFRAKQKAMNKGGSGLGAMEKADQEAILKGYKRGGSIKSNITAIKSKIKAKIKSKIMAIKKPLLKAQVGMSTPQNKKSSSAQATQYIKPTIPGGSTGDVAKSSVGNFKRGGSIKMKAGGTMKMKTGGMVNSNKKVLVKATYGTAMKPTMMKMGGSTLKKAMYGSSMMKPSMMKKGGAKKK